MFKIDDTKEIYYDQGSCRYYMGDLGDSEEYIHNFPNASIIEKDGGITSDGLIKANELLDQYKVKLINWNYTSPIKNYFSPSKSKK